MVKQASKHGPGVIAGKRVASMASYVSIAAVTNCHVSRLSIAAAAPAAARAASANRAAWHTPPPPRASHVGGCIDFSASSQQAAQPAQQVDKRIVSTLEVNTKHPIFGGLSTPDVPGDNTAAGATISSTSRKPLQPDQQGTGACRLVHDGAASAGGPLRRSRGVRGGKNQRRDTFRPVLAGAEWSAAPPPRLLPTPPPAPPPGWQIAATAPAPPPPARLPYGLSAPPPPFSQNKHYIRPATRPPAPPSRRLERPAPPGAPRAPPKPSALSAPPPDPGAPSAPPRPVLSAPVPQRPALEAPMPQRPALRAPCPCQGCASCAPLHLLRDATWGLGRPRRWLRVPGRGLTVPGLVVSWHSTPCCSPVAEYQCFPIGARATHRVRL